MTADADAMAAAREARDGGARTILVLADPRDRHLAALSPAPAGIRFVVGARPEDLAPHAAQAEALLAWWSGADEVARVLAMAPRLRWVHSASAGLDRIVSPALAAAPVVLTNSRGVFSASLAEFVLASVLFFAKDLARMRRAQARAAWDPFTVGTIAGKTLGVVGHGDIGQASARLCRAAGMRVVACRKRPELSAGDPALDAVLATPREVCAASDYVLVAAPLTPETRGLVGAAEIAAMRPHAVLVNVGRGALVDEDALVAALREGRIGGAALDVFATEPLPAEHPFWGMDQVLVSPHCADRTATWLDEAVALFLDNVARFRDGAPLASVVDARRGY